MSDNGTAVYEFQSAKYENYPHYGTLEMKQPRETDNAVHVVSFFNR